MRGNPHWAWVSPSVYERTFCSAGNLVLFGAYQVLDAWIARVSREEREALEARQQAMMEGQQEGGHVSH